MGCEEIRRESWEDGSCSSAALFIFMRSVRRWASWGWDSGGDFGGKYDIHDISAHWCTVRMQRGELLFQRTILCPPIQRCSVADSPSLSPHICRSPQPTACPTWLAILANLGPPDMRVMAFPVNSISQLCSQIYFPTVSIVSLDSESSSHVYTSSN